MQQDPDQAEKEDDKASTAGMSSLDFKFLSDFENGTDTLEATTDPADEGTSTLEPSSASMGERTGTCRRATLRAILKIPNRNSSWNHQGTCLSTFLGNVAQRRVGGAS